ncbi:MAG: hypothetical protein KDD40_09070 [Bdellovibrionales bacterium]|nr:hypothetical protein [Bdellovibrionales bacterium]
MKQKKIENNKSAALDKFENYLTHLHEVEYGDFKRKLSLYILRLEQAYGANANIQVKKLFNEMREKAIYNPTGNIEITRVEIMDLAKKLPH